MGMVRLIFRRMSNNKWLVMSLLLGLILAVSLTSTIPMYNEAILRKVLKEELMNLQNETGVYSGYVRVSTYFENIPNDERSTVLHQMDDFLHHEASDLPLFSFVTERSTNAFTLVPNDPDQSHSAIHRTVTLSAMSDLENHIDITNGRFPKKQPDDSIYEVLITEDAMFHQQILLDHEYIIQHPQTSEKLSVKPVGIFRQKFDHELYWYEKNSEVYQQTFFLPYEVFEEDFTKNQLIPPVSSTWYLAFDFSNLRLQHIEQFEESIMRIDRKLTEYFSNFNIIAPASKAFQEFSKKEFQLFILLWTLFIPMIAMLFIYLYMASDFLIKKQSKELFLLISRGASFPQIFFMYFIESSIFGFVSILIGPFLAKWFVQVIGASNGFLSFVNRESLTVELNSEVYFYAILAAIFSIFSTILPVYIHTKKIFYRKQSRSKRKEQSFVHQFFLDVLLILLSLYGIWLYQSKNKYILESEFDLTGFYVDPLLFIVPSLFILGVSIFLLRLYPFVMSMIHRMGNRFWHYSFYISLIQVTRNFSHYRLFMLLFMITIATGLFSSSAARTINQNIEDQIHYLNGTDMVLKPQWFRDQIPQIHQEPNVQQDTTTSLRLVRYIEPPFEPFTQLSGVQEATKVFIKNEASIRFGNHIGTVSFMGIITDEFGRIAWYRHDLMDHHLHAFLNLIALEPAAVLISKSLSEDKQIHVGDVIELNWEGLKPRKFIVYGIVDYFPSYHKHRSDGNQSNYLVIGNLSFIQNQLAIEPYEVWMKLDGETSRNEFYDSLAHIDVPITSISDVTEKIIKSRNDPFRLAINGVLSLVFTISVITCFIGFLIYWIMSTMNRTYQIGILRSSGFTKQQMVFTFLFEQGLITGGSLIMGGFVGKMSSVLFVPFFQISMVSSTNALPFLVILNDQDKLKLYFIIGLIFLIGFVILNYISSRVRLYEAMNLGEDSNH